MASFKMLTGISPSLKKETSAQGLLSSWFLKIRNYEHEFKQLCPSASEIMSKKGVWYLESRMFLTFLLEFSCVFSINECSLLHQSNSDHSEGAWWIICMN